MTRSCVFSYRGAVALTTALSLALTPAAPLLAAPAPSQAAAAAPAAAKPSATAAPAKAVLASVDKSQILPKNAEGVKSDPPKIFFSQGPALLVNLDGEAIWSPIKDNDLKFAVNTNWDLFQHESTKTFYLRNEKAWLKATSRERGHRPARCPRASGSCRPTTTGRM